MSSTATRIPAPTPTGSAAAGGAQATADPDPNAPCPLNPRPDPTRGASAYPSATIPRDVPLPWNNQTVAPTAFNITGCLTSFAQHPKYPKHVEWLCPNAAGNGSFHTGYVMGWVQAHADRPDRFLAIDDPAYYLSSNVGGKQWDQECTFPSDPLGLTWPPRNSQCAGCSLGYSLTTSNITISADKQWFLHGCLSVRDDRGQVQQACSWLDLPVGAWCLHPDRTQRMARSLFTCEKDGKSDVGLVGELLRGVSMEARSEEGGLPLAVKIGIGIGGSLVLIAVLAFSFFIYRQRKLARSAHSHTPIPQSQDAPSAHHPSSLVDIMSQPVPVAMPHPQPPTRESTRMAYAPMAPHDPPFLVAMAAQAQAKKDEHLPPPPPPLPVAQSNNSFVFSPAPAHLQMVPPPRMTTTPSQVSVARADDDEELILAPAPAPAGRRSTSQHYG